MKFCIIGNPENRRISMFSAALEQLGLGQPFVYSYEQLLESPLLPEKMMAEGAVIRIESPGENQEVRKGMILWGQQQLGSSISREQLNKHLADFGRIGYGREWYAGFIKMLKLIEAQLAISSRILFMNHPQDILSMFHKRSCHERLLQHAVAVPKALPLLNSYEALKAAMQAGHSSRVFIKPLHSSSASGVVAFRMAGGKYEAITAVEMLKEGAEYRLYNSLKVRSYRSEQDIAPLLDGLLKEEALVEEWIPKASIQGGVFDLRILVIGGRARHLVARLSNTPLTNLHLGNKRVLAEALEKRLGAAKLEEARKLAEAAAAQFPDSLYAGVDILLASDLKLLKVLEVNAFGDLLPGLLHEGQGTYTAEIATLLQQNMYA